MPSEEVALTSEQLVVVPSTGEAIDLADPAACARALREIRTLEARLREVKKELVWGVLEESRRQGSKTLRLSDGIVAKVSTQSATTWDYEVLCELLAAGLPEERFTELVTTEISYKVNGGVARSVAASNPEYAAIIERARTVSYGEPSVSVT